MAQPRHSFPANRRLCGEGFSAVFGAPDCRKTNSAVSVVARANQEGFNRLGIVVSKRNVRSAVDRNVIKRVIRETFRNMSAVEQGQDMIVVVRGRAAHMTKGEIASKTREAFGAVAGQGDASLGEKGGAAK